MIMASNENTAPEEPKPVETPILDLVSKTASEAMTAECAKVNQTLIDQGLLYVSWINGEGVRFSVAIKGTDKASRFKTAEAVAHRASMHDHPSIVTIGFTPYQGLPPKKTTSESYRIPLSVIQAAGMSPRLAQKRKATP